MLMRYVVLWCVLFFFFFSSRRRHTRSLCDWSSDVCSSDLLEFRSDDLFWCYAFLHPALQGRGDIVLRVSGGHTRLSERVRAGAPGAMLHARHHVKAHELRCLLLAYFFLHTLVVADDVARRDRRVAPPVIQNQLAAPRLEGFQVGVAGRQIRAGSSPGDLHVAIEVEGIEVPGRLHS